MSIALRVLLVFGSIIVLVKIGQSIKKQHIQMRDAIYWVVVSLVLLIMAIFPEPIIGIARLIGIESPANFVYLVVIGMLVLKLFSNASEISILKHKVNELSEEVALTRAKED